MSTLLGVDVTATPSDSTTNNDKYSTDTTHKLGQVHRDHRGYEYIYVHANGAITQYAVVSIDETYEATMITNTLAATAQGVGVAQVAFADNDYGWVQIRGQATVLVLASCAADVVLYTSASAGYLDDTATALTVINGIVLTSSRSASAGSAPCSIVVNPFAKLPGN